MSTKDRDQIEQRLIDFGYDESGANELIDTLAGIGIYLTDDLCIGKLKPGEPYFVLRGQDVIASTLVEEWARHMEGYYGATLDLDLVREKVASAHALARAMLAWPERKWPD